MDLFRRLFGKSTTTIKDSTPPKDDQNVTAAIVADKPADADATPVEAPPPPSMKASPSPSIEDFGATRPLPPETMIMPPNGHILFGQATDVGQVRSNNQDSALSFFFMSQTVEERPDFGLFIVADGMGGHNDGEKASSVTVRAVAKHITNAIYLPMLAAGETTSDMPTIAEALIEAARQANTSVINQVPNGGTTLTATAVMGDLAHIVHVGDSRGYLITKEGIEQITRDHSLVQRLIELDQLTPEEAIDHPQKNVLYRAIGHNDQLEVDTLTRRLPSDSRLLLCSDGLWGLMEEDEIRDIVMNNPNPQDACDKLVELANSHGGIDNITAVLLKLPSS